MKLSAAVVAAFLFAPISPVFAEGAPVEHKAVEAVAPAQASDVKAVDAKAVDAKAVDAKAVDAKVEAVSTKAEDDCKVTKGHSWDKASNTCKKDAKIKK